MEDWNAKRSALLRGAGTLLAAGLAVHLLTGLLESFRLASVLVGAVIVNLFASRIGAKWNDEEGVSRWRSARRFLFGFAAGAVASTLAFVVLLSSGLARLQASDISANALGLGLVVVTAESFRDEFLYRGMPLCTMRGQVNERAAILFVGLLSVMPIVGQPRPGLAAVVICFSFALLSALAWRFGKGLLVAWGLRTGFVFVGSVLAGGGLVDVILRDGALYPLDNAKGSSANSLAVGLGIVALAGLALYARYHRRSQAGSV